MKETTPVVPDVALGSGSGMVPLSHGKDAGILEVECVDHVLAIVFIPQGLKFLAAVAYHMAAPRYATVLADDGHLLQQANVGHVIDRGQRACLRGEPMNLLIHPRVVPAVFIPIPFVVKGEGSD